MADSRTSPLWPKRPFSRSLERHDGNRLNVFFKWFAPGFLNGCCIFISMWLLHIATYQYVHRMSSEEGAFHKNTASDDTADHLLQDYGGLKDPLAQLFPKQDMPLSLLDGVAAVIPAAFMIGMFVYDDLNLYTKIMFCNGLLALLKGTVDAMTIVPDSAGWEACKARLTPLGVSYMQEDHSVWELLVQEATGVKGKHLRWCSDMLISGHTYFTTIYALGVYELVRKVTRPLERNHPIKVISICLIVLFLAGEQLLEIYFVIVDRFHYTADIYISIIFTLLIYTNVVPAAVAKWWMMLGQQPNGTTLQDVVTSESDVLVPVCCFPFCCFAGRHHIYDDPQMEALINEVLKGESEDVRRRARGVDLVGGGVQVGCLVESSLGYVQVQESPRQ